MKKLLILMLLFTVVCGAGLSAETEFGLELTSGGKTFLWAQAGFLELAVGARAHLGDGSNPFMEELLFGAHTGLVFGLPANGSELSIGAEGWTGVSLEDTDYTEYIDIALRIGLYQRIGGNLRIEGILFPLSISTRELETSSESWFLSAIIPSAEVAVLFHL